MITWLTEHVVGTSRGTIDFKGDDISIWTLHNKNITTLYYGDPDLFDKMVEALCN